MYINYNFHGDWLMALHEITRDGSCRVFDFCKFISKTVSSVRQETVNGEIGEILE